MKIFWQMFSAMLLVGLFVLGQPAVFAASTPAVSFSTFPITITDGTGRVVKIASAPRRIVSLSPAATDILVKVGAHAELIGVTRYAVVPAGDEAHVKRLGEGLDPDYEGILALKPDLVIVPLLADKSMQEKLSALGLTCVVLHPEGLAGVLDDIRMVGLATGHNAEGEAIDKNIEAIRALVQSRSKTMPEAKRPRVLIRMDDVSPAPGSYVDDLLTVAGGRNVLPRGAKAWVTVSPESVLQLNPDLVVDIPLPGDSGTSDASAPKLPGGIKAKTLADGLAFYRPGPDLGQALWQLARVIYPNLFPELSPPTPTTPPAG